MRWVVEAKKWDPSEASAQLAESTQENSGVEQREKSKHLHRLCICTWNCTHRWTTVDEEGLPDQLK